MYVLITAHPLSFIQVFMEHLHGSGAIPAAGEVAVGNTSIVPALEESQHHFHSLSSQPVIRNDLWTGLVRGEDSEQMIRANYFAIRPPVLTLITF